MADRQIVTRHVGDTRTALAATLKRPGETAGIDLSGLTVKFFMVDAQTGTTKVTEADTNVTVTDASAGEVQYNWQADDVDTAGTYYGYFTVWSGTDYETFPPGRGDLEITFEDDS